MNKRTFIQHFFPIVFFFLLAPICFSQTKTLWTVKDPFEKRCFIENLGQFNEPKQENGSTVLYGSFTQGTHIFFTNKGFIINYYNQAKKSRKELRVEERRLNELRRKGGLKIEEEEDEDEIEKFKYVPVYQELIWQGASSSINVIASNKIETYFCYPENGSTNTLKAKAFKKIIYRDVYPNIDVEFYFPKDSIGFKYNYIVKPGGNPALIKEKWMRQPKAELNTNGDLIIESKYGNVISKKPVSFYLTKQNSSPLETSYQLTDDIVSYSITGDVSAGIIIDPWVTTPVFTAGTNGYDIDFDISGNTYIYGGGAGVPFQLLKFNDLGGLSWSYATSIFGAGAGYYGDFAVDQISGTSYITNGYCFPGVANVLKVSASGLFVASHFGSAAMNEMWRIAFSSCTNQAVIGGGGTSGFDQICYLDTNLTSLTTVNVLAATSAGKDIALLTVDNFGYCYFLHAKSPGAATPYDNKIVKAPMPTFLPLTYSVSTVYDFRELTSPTFSGGNGFNGIAVGNKSLYAYDSYTLTKRNTTAGALLITKPINYPVGGDDTKMYWSGITVDDCQNLFFGSRDTVYHYDSLLNEIGFYPMPNTVYDLKLSREGILYVTGKSFVTAVLPTGIASCASSIIPNLNVTNATCYTTGSASVSPTGGVAPYNISWNTVPVQTGLTATGLTPGTYTVTITDSSCSGNYGVETFTIITESGGFLINATIQNVSCNGSVDGTISLNPSGGNDPYSFSWDTLGLTSSNASGLGAGTYGVLVTDSAGCYDSIEITVIEPIVLTASTNADTVNCFGGNTSIVCFPVGGTPGYTVVWNTSLPVLGDTIPIASAGIYSITVTDSNGCVLNFTDTLYEPSPLTLTLIGQDVSCDGTILGNITANVLGGTGSYDYLWSNDITNNTNVDLNLPAGVYLLTVTDENGCTISGSDTIFSVIAPTVTFTLVEPCNGGSNGSITALPVGGTPGSAFIYSWNTSPVQTGLVANNVDAGAYVFSVQSSGCTFTFPVLLGQNPIIDTMKMDGVICGKNNFVTLYLQESAQPTYTWYLDGNIIPGANIISYDAPMGDIPLITATWFMNGCRYLTTTIETKEYPFATASVIPNVFSPNGDGFNNLYYAFTFIGSTDASEVSFLFEEFTMQIFNRWGQLIFESTDPNKGWNGKDAGNTDVAEGVYFVMIKFAAICADKEGENIYNGTIQLVR